MEEMLGCLNSFSITEEEAMVIGISNEVMEKGREEARFGLLGKILSSKPYNMGSVMSTMDKLAKVLAMEPWSFNKSLILKAVNGDKALQWDSWSLTCFWIRVYNLLYDGMIREIREKIGNGIGKFIDVVTDKNGRCPGIYMWVPDFCFGCGRVGHGRLECVDDRVRNLNSSDRLLYSSELRADIHPLGLGKASGGRRDGNGGRSKRSGELHHSMPEFPENLTEIQILSKTVAEIQDPISSQIPVSRDSVSLVAPIDRRDMGVAITTNLDYIPFIPRNQWVDDTESSSHVGGTHPFNKTVSLGGKPIIVGPNVNVPSSRLELLLHNSGGMHATIHVDKKEAEVLVFSAGVVESVKRNAGKWKKEARLKGVIGSVSSSSGKLKNVKRKMDMEFSSRSHIDVDVTSDLGDEWRFTFYGPTKKKAHRHAWKLLKRLRTNPDVPWICGGDFNEVLNPSEVDSGGERSLSDMLLFRFVANTSWRLKFRRANVVVLNSWGSNYKAFLLQPMPNRKKDNKRKSGGFRFEPLWAKHEECPGIVEDLWHNLHFDGSPNRLASGLTFCAGTLRRWGLRKFGNIPKRAA
ncbi:hypothetical protein TIFTF001_009667 [Ficus carica]|uniref:CCHC-type domain-containing protein n=1 Tax=Ficus carica TaxID=3494 RepID=A0AA88DHJ2_FICCA|nr:hypothetical protein TIFTF001_009667 [Ficus carica]